MCVSSFLSSRGQRSLAVLFSRLGQQLGSPRGRLAPCWVAWCVGLALLVVGLGLTGCVLRLPEELDGRLSTDTTDGSSDPSGGSSGEASGDDAGRGHDSPDAAPGFDASDGSGQGPGAAPELLNTAPENGATDVALDVSVTLTFDIPVQPGDGIVNLYRTGDDSPIETLDIAHARVTFLQASVTIDWENTLRTATQYYIELEPGAVLSATGVPYAGFVNELSFTTRLPSPLVVVAKSPVNEAQEVDPNTRLVLTFNEMVEAGSGEFALYAWDEQTNESQLVERFEVDSERVRINDSSVTLEPSTSLDYSTRYYVLADEGVVVSLMGAPYEGIAGSSAWTFVTAEAAPPPLVLEALEPDNGAVDVAVDAKVALLFDQPIRSGSGTITIYVGTTGQPFDSAEVSDPRVTVSANRAEFAPSTEFDYATEYYVLVSAGTFESRDGASFEGIASASQFAFTTTGTPPSCGEGETLREGTRDCYFLGDDSAVSWDAAREACIDRGEGWDLVAIRSAEEQQFIETLIITETWIGASDRHEDGDWRWVRDDTPFWSGNRDGQAVDGAYVRWWTDEPSGGTQPPEECARLINKGSGWYWADVQCQNSLQFLCQGPAD